MSVTSIEGGARAVVRASADLARAWPALIIAAAALLTTPYAPWRPLGALSSALIVGMAIRALRDARGRSPGSAEDAGLKLLATHVLRIAVVASALRLDWAAIAAAGSRPWIVAAVAVVGGLVAFAALGRALGLSSRLTALIAIGTSVCGAAAIVAAAPRIGARDEDATLGVAAVSVLGAALALALVGAHALGLIEGETYALVTGGGLHEVAHVAAASAAAPEVAGLALLTKLARVAMLPLGLVMLPLVAPADAPTEQTGKTRIPGLAIAFFAVSILGSMPSLLASSAPELATAWPPVRDVLLAVANAALAASMAAIGLRVAPRALAAVGGRSIALAVVGALVVLLLVITAARLA